MCADKTETKNVPVLAGNQLRAIVPDSLDAAYRLAQAFVSGGVTPRGMSKPAEVMIAILAGLEVGLTPLQAVAGLYVVNGRPVLFGDALVAVVRASGKCGYIKTWIEGQGDTVVAWAETQRIGEAEPMRASFSWAQAKKAGLTGKSGPWTTHPARMLIFKAKNFLLRDVYADILHGLGGDETSEPLEVGDVTPQQQERATPPDPDMPEDKVEDAEVEEMSETKTDLVSDKSDGPPDPDEEGVDQVSQQLLSAFQSGLKLAKTPDDVEELWNDLEVEPSLTHDEDSLAMATALKDKAIKKLTKAKK